MDSQISLDLLWVYNENKPSGVIDGSSVGDAGRFLKKTPWWKSSMFFPSVVVMSVGFSRAVAAAGGGGTIARWLSLDS